MNVDVGEREVWLSIRGVGGFAEGTVYAFTDLTEDRRLEQQKADFIATVSHGSGRRLAAVHGAAKTLQREDVVAGTEVFEHLLALIAEQSDRLAGMVDDILLASRIDSPSWGWRPSTSTSGRSPPTWSRPLRRTRANSCNSSSLRRRRRRRCWRTATGCGRS